jgi:hypothetical protein
VDFKTPVRHVTAIWAEQLTMSHHHFAIFEYKKKLISHSKVGMYENCLFNSMQEIVYESD